MQSNHVCGALGNSRNRVDIQVRRVRRQDRSRLADRIQLFKNGLLHAHLFEHGLDHQIRRTKIVIRRCQRQRFGRDLVKLILADLAALERARQVALNPATRGFCRVCVHLQKLDRQAGQERSRRNPGTHGPATDHRERLHLARCHTLEFGQIRHGTFRKKRMDHTLPLRGLHQLHKDPAFLGYALGKGLFDRCLDRTHRHSRRNLPAPLRQNRVIGRVPIQGIRADHLADRAPPLAFVQQTLRKGQPVLQRRAVCKLINQTHPVRFSRADMATRGDHLDRGLCTGDARQTLCAARAWDQTQMHLRQPNLRAWNSHAVMRTKRHFQAATQRHAMHRGNHRLGAGLNPGAKIWQKGCKWRFPEFFDIRASKKRASRADDDNGSDPVVSLCLGQAVQKTLAHGLAKGVYWWVICCDDPNFAMTR